ncbi:hypothetical protein [Oerskovia enterophila]|uniref:Uncharacterized protein n=1 Tax=Oerskovia enterophila TaxID=43678 RepID=A0ABX2Y942_9CELL|nr:hypothetical protein [Oerskovia enterophila]OCI32783.1 hypothetical protein OERS_03750 [Oerskovia enterophila]
MSTRRRQYLTEEGQGLLGIDSPHELVARAVQFSLDTGLEPSDLIVSTCCAVPLPDWEGRGPGMRWQEMNPAMMWHPLLWMPESATAPHQVPTEGLDVTFTEENEHIATRIALVAITSGLYDPDQGTWVDVLSLYGLDIEDPAVQERVGAWLGGDDDEVLDKIDLGEFTDRVVNIETLALDVSAAAEDAGICVTTREAIEMIDELFDPDTSQTDEHRRQVLTELCMVLAAVMPRRLVGVFLTVHDEIRSSSPVDSFEIHTIDQDHERLEAGAQSLSATLQEIEAESTDGAAAFVDMFTARLGEVRSS